MNDFAAFGPPPNTRGLLRSASKVVEQISNACKGIRFAKARCKVVIDRAHRIINEVQESTQRAGIGVASSHLNEFQQKLEEVRAIVQKLADMSFLKALLQSDMISQELGMTHRILSDCLHIFHIKPVSHAQAEQDNAAKADRAMLQNIFKDIKGDYVKIRHCFGIKSHEEENQAVVAMERALSHTASRDVLETQIIKSSLECIKSSTGKTASEQKRWLITDYELDFSGEIGGGGFSTVRKAKFRGTMVAVKILKDVGNSRALEKEVDIWRELRNDYIVPFYGACTLTSNPYIVCRYMRNGNLTRYLSRQPNVDRTKLLHEISLGMVYLHGERIVHGDLKGVNVLVDDAGKACITDFGLSCIESPASTGAITNKVPGTLRYLAPEALKGRPLNFTTDVYAFGMVIYEVFTGEGPFISIPDDQIWQGNLTLTRPNSKEISARGLNDGMWKLLLDTSSHDPAARPPFETIRKRIESAAQGYDSPTFELVDAESSWDEHERAYENMSSHSIIVNYGQALLTKEDFSPEKLSFTSSASLVHPPSSERPMFAGVTCKYFNVEFGLVKSREPGVYLEENDAFKWQPVSGKKGTILREEPNRFTYRRTIGEGADSWELDGDKVVLQASSVNALSYSRDGSVAVWGSSSCRVSGDWVTKTSGWRRIVGGKLQMAPSVDGAPNLMPSSWDQVDVPKRYIIDGSNGDTNSLTCIVNPKSSRPTKLHWHIRGRTVVFTSHRFNDQTPTLVKEEDYSMESEARVMFTAMKIILERGQGTEVARSTGKSSSVETIGKESEKGKHPFPWFRRKHDTRIDRPQETPRGATPGIRVFTQWMYSRTPDASNSAAEAYNVLSYEALLKARSGNCNAAYAYARKSIDIRPSTMGYIAMALAQVKNNQREEALGTFDFALGNCNPDEGNLLLLIKVVMLFVASRYDEAIARMRQLMDASKDDETMYSYIQVLGKMYLMRGDYRRALQSLKGAQDLTLLCTGRDLGIISLIFGWEFDGPQITIQRCYCEDLLGTGCVQEATHILLEILGTVRVGTVTPDWVMGLQQKCADMLKALGDTAFSSGEHVEAIAQYSFALSLSPPNPADILVKRGKARTAKGLWEDALMDANEVIRLDVSSYRGYEAKYIALHGAKRYGEAIDAIISMFSLIEHSLDEESCELRGKYTPPQETISTIDNAIGTVFNLCPLVLIDLTTGQLCRAEERIRVFKSEKTFKKLVSDAVMEKIESRHILRTVTKYFQWTMFSHTWTGKEPTFKDVNLVKSVWDLDYSPLNEKLQQFCATARRDGRRWVWSDTCCIDRDTSSILSQSLTSMYTWYAEAAETLVYLVDVEPSSGPGALTKSRWMTRAWTLQELLASKVVRFYDRTWKPYLNDMSTNHKESPAIKGELARAMGVAPETITGFRPEDLGVQEKLRLASTREATVTEDVAYSLIGIFSSDIVPRYGLGKIALGQLLEDIIARSGDVTVIAWTGESLPYNSALPCSLNVYNQTPHGPPSIQTDELDALAERLQTRLPQQDVLAFYLRVIQLPRANFSNRCLHLPCIIFAVTKVWKQESDSSRGNLYCALASSLGNVKFRTKDVIPFAMPQQLVFVHPWLHDLRDHLDMYMSHDEQEVESISGSGKESIPRSTSLLHAEPLSRPDRHTQALRLIARLGRPFNALFLQQQSNGQYKRIAAEHKIHIPGVPYKTNFKKITVKVLEVV